MTFVGFTHSGGETYRASDTVGSLTQQSASETSAMTPLIAGPLGGGNDGTGRRTEDDPNLVTYSGHGEGQTAVANALKVPSHGASWSGSSSDTFVSGGASVRRLTPTECERLQSLPDGWTNPTGDAPDSRRYAALGDAVTSTVAYWIGRRILEAA